jgi:hypothetical protein
MLRPDHWQAAACQRHPGHLSVYIHKGCRAAVRSWRAIIAQNLAQSATSGSRSRILPEFKEAPFSGRQQVVQVGLSGRIDFQAGDYLQDELPGEQDGTYNELRCGALPVAA